MSRFLSQFKLSRLLIASKGSVFPFHYAIVKECIFVSFREKFQIIF